MHSKSYGKRLVVIFLSIQFDVLTHFYLHDLPTNIDAIIAMADSIGKLIILIQGVEMCV